MLVDVRGLYRAGVRLPRDEVRATVPVRGELSLLKYFSWTGHEIAPVFATVSGFQLYQLDKARVIYLRGRNMVLAGEQGQPKARANLVVSARRACDG